MKRSLFVLVPLALLASTTVRADPGFQLDRFDPSERGSEWFALDSLDLRGHGRPALGVVFDGADRPLAIYNTDGSLRSSIVGAQIFGHIGGTVVLWDRLRLGASFPIAFYQNGDGGTVNGVSYAAPGSFAVGDLRLSADVRLVGAYGDAFTLAGGVVLYAPTGSQTDFTSDGQTRVQPRLLVAGDIGSFVYAAKLGFQYRGMDTPFAGSAIGSEVGFGISAGLRVADKALVLGPEIYGGAVVSNSDQIFKTRTTPVEGLFGAHYTVARDWRFGAGIGPGFTRGYGSPVLRVVASLEWAPGVGPADRDHDGIADNDDACPDVPGVKTNDPKTNGCPPPPPDRDHDGIIDSEDACPDVPGVKTDDPKTNGCPPPPPDRDHDGIIDSEDACPDVPGVKTNDPKTNGCPPPPPDRDHDGIIDSEDACPDVPGVKTNDPKTNGCPPDPDRDHDGIPNDQDACPDEPGPKNPDPKKNGCPQAVVRDAQIVILDQVKFATASAVILPASTPVLTAVTKILKEHPEIKKISIEGHTDNQGPAAYNKQLSASRAASVATWLVNHGIERARLSSAGYGMERPIDKNDTAEGRQNNRRVEFHIKEQGQ